MKILIFGNEYQQRYASELRHLVEVLCKRGAEVDIETGFYTYLRDKLGIDCAGTQCHKACDMWGDVALSIGGDGTLLRTARVVAKKCTHPGHQYGTLRLPCRGKCI